MCLLDIGATCLKNGLCHVTHASALCSLAGPPAFANAARAKGAQVLWNAAPAKEIPIADFALVDTLIVNRLEAADLIGHEHNGLSPAATLAKLAELAPDAEIILTMGATARLFLHQGSLVKCKKRIRST